MDTRILGVIGRSIPLLLRHLDGYVELAQQDWMLAKRNAARSMQGLAVIVVSGFLALQLGCGVIIALTWDTSYRVLAIGLLAGTFGVLAIVTAIALTRQRPGAFSTLRREWRADRALLRQILEGSELDDEDSASVSAGDGETGDESSQRSARAGNGDWQRREVDDVYEQR